METRWLGRDAQGRGVLPVSLVGLGTMTWGEQNTEAEAHAQLDAAVASGVTLIDAAEMYPVPPRHETQGRTEAFLGSWLRRRGGSHDLVIATKIVGPGGFRWIRDGRTRFTRGHLVAAVEGSLARLGIERIDLYQLHWPDRPVSLFGQRAAWDPDAPWTPPEETLRDLEDLVRDGKIGHLGLSNETAWGVMRFVAVAEAAGLPRVVSVQNAHHLLHRKFEGDLAEVALREGVPLLAYSPLAMGLLSGKYAGGARPAGARLTRFTRFTRYMSPAAHDVADRYAALARASGLTPTELALGFVGGQPFVGSVLVGATSVAQLEENVRAVLRPIPDDLRAAVDAIHDEAPNPVP